MSIAGLIGGIVLLAIAIATIGQPFVTKRERGGDMSVDQLAREELLTTYERVLATIRDLDEDFQTGKLSEEPYKQERAQWTRQGIMLLKKLDPDSTAREDVPLPKQERNKADEDLDAAIENAIADYRQARA